MSADQLMSPGFVGCPHWLSLRRACHGARPGADLRRSWQCMHRRWPCLQLVFEVGNAHSKSPGTGHGSACMGGGRTRSWRCQRMLERSEKLVVRKLSIMRRSWQCMHGWWPYLELALPTVGACCLEWWLYEGLILIAGAFPNPDSAGRRHGLRLQHYPRSPIRSATALAVSGRQRRLSPPSGLLRGQDGALAGALSRAHLQQSPQSTARSPCLWRCNTERHALKQLKAWQLCSDWHALHLCEHARWKQESQKAGLCSE